MLFLPLLELVALRGGTVHTMLPGDEARVATVLVRDGRIEAVGEDLAIPADARAIDASGEHVLPGLVDAMIHHDPEHDALYALAGITLARDMGNDIGRIFAARDSEGRRALAAPELAICGGVLDGLPPVTTEAVVVTSAAEVDEKLPRLVELGLDFVSFHLGTPEVAWRRVLELAHEEDLAVWGPLPRGVALEAALGADQDGIVGIEAFLPEGTTWASADVEELAGRARACAEARTAVMPLLHASAARCVDQLERGAPAILELLSPGYAALWTAELARRRPALDAAARERCDAELARQGELVRELWKAGVALVPGSGAPNPWLEPGAGLHDELAAWVAAGIPPRDVLRLATRGAAAALGHAKERGAIEPGFVADLVCVAGDPTEDLALLREPTRVILRGHVLERADLDRLRETLRERQAAARARAARPLDVAAPELPPGELVLSGHVEAIAGGQRVAAERYALVQLAEGGTAYCSRMATVLAGMEAPAETELVQRIEDGRVASFELAIHRGENALTVRGVAVGGQFRIERRMNGLHIDTVSMAERIAVVDAGSVTAALVLARHAHRGPLSGIYFEDAEPAVGRWELEVQEDGMHLLRSASGPWAATFRPEDGALLRMERYQGSGVIAWRAIEPEVAPSAPPAGKDG